MKIRCLRIYVTTVRNRTSACGVTPVSMVSNQQELMKQGASGNEDTIGTILPV